MEFLGQGSDPSHSCDLCHSYGNAGSFNPLCWAQGQTCALVLQGCRQSHCATGGTPHRSFLKTDVYLNLWLSLLPGKMSHPKICTWEDFFFFLISFRVLSEWGSCVATVHFLVEIIQIMQHQLLSPTIISEAGQNFFYFSVN